MMKKLVCLFLIFNSKLIGYVQGMNFIAAFFLYHAEEYIAFTLFAMLMYKLK